MALAKLGISRCCCPETPLPPITPYPCPSNPPVQTEPRFSFGWDNPPFNYRFSYPIVGDELRVPWGPNTLINPQFEDPTSPSNALPLPPDQLRLVQAYWEYDIQEPPLISGGILLDISTNSLPVLNDTVTVSIFRSGNDWFYNAEYLGVFSPSLQNPALPIRVRWQNDYTIDAGGDYYYQQSAFFNGALISQGTLTRWSSWTCANPPCPFQMQYPAFVTRGTGTAPDPSSGYVPVKAPAFGLVTNSIPCPAFSISYPDYTTPGETNNPSYNWTLNANYAQPEQVAVNRTGGVDPVRYASSGTLPVGWSLDTSTGLISRPGAVIPTSGNGTFTITATDANSDTAQATVTWIQV